MNRVTENRDLREDQSTTSAYDILSEREGGFWLEKTIVR